jgi:alkanesulfonate monooxygenase SsuD/methylene tetrahydromethanopterin reductase-like flavin-dependent oxidoreductase (luciferase family)
MKLFVATLTCKQFATFKQPTRAVAIVAASYDEALGKAIQQAHGIWREPGYSEHSADIAEVSQALLAQTKPVRPIIVCLCGSTRFWRIFQQASLQETMAGRIVLSIGAASGTDDEHFGNLPRDEYDRIKTMLDDLHMRKIDLCDEVLVLNLEGYIGESTARELAYARKLGKIVRFWEPEL